MQIISDYVAIANMAVKIIHMDVILVVGFLLGLYFIGLWHRPTSFWHSLVLNAALQFLM